MLRAQAPYEKSSSAEAVPAPEPAAPSASTLGHHVDIRV
jgi:hypothetical protein